MRKDCDTCKHDEFCWQDGYCDDCLAGNPPSRWEASDYYVPDTNADRVRTMTDEELADWHEDCPYIEKECTMIGCRQCILEWLRKPVED